MIRLIDIVDEDITMGDRGCENSCPIALALRNEYNTTNISVVMEDRPYIFVNDDELNMTSNIIDTVDNFIKKYDSGQDVEPFTLEIIEWYKIK